MEPLKGEISSSSREHKEASFLKGKGKNRDRISRIESRISRIESISSSITNAAEPRPITVIKSKSLGQVLVNTVFGNSTERKGAPSFRNYFLNKFHTEEVTLKTADGLELNGTIVKPHPKAEQSGKTYIYCSGSYGCYEEYVKDFGNQDGILSKLINEGHQVLLFDYRGFGENFERGQPTAEGICLDGEAAYQCMENHGVESKDIIMYGYSMGGPVAAKVASEHKTSLVLDRVLDDTGASAQEGLPSILGSIAKRVINKKFPLSTINNLRDFQGEKLKIILEQDRSRKDFRLQKFENILQELERDPQECLKIYEGMPHIFTNNDNERPSNDFLDNIVFK